MNIEEAIKHTREVATKKRILAQDKNILNDNVEECEECAKEHEQLAEWLIKLKEYQDLEADGRLARLPCKVALQGGGCCISNKYRSNEACNPTSSC